MKAATLIAAKGLAYAVNIIDSAPASATQWNEGYEFTCGQSVTISAEDREKYFVDMAELKRVVWSLRRIDTLGGIAEARELLKHAVYTAEKSITAENDFVVKRLKSNIQDWEETFITEGVFVEVDFISESSTQHSGTYFKGQGVVDKYEDGRVFGRLHDGTPFMCFPCDVIITGKVINKHLAETEKLNRLG
ncbi:hypothetical protein A7P55_03520 [Acinetobacter sp. Ac_5812]|nr:hypothetical protein [Acinetobacter sp. Ac_5812]